MNEWTELDPSETEILLVDEVRIGCGTAVTDEGDVATMVIEVVGIGPEGLTDESVEDRTVYLALSGPAERQLKLEMAKWLHATASPDEDPDRLKQLGEISSILLEAEELINRLQTKTDEK
jgi:hypothetical protein